MPATSTTAMKYTRPRAKRIYRPGWPAASLARTDHLAVKHVSQYSLQSRVHMVTQFLRDQESMAELVKANVVVFPHQGTWRVGQWRGVLRPGLGQPGRGDAVGRLRRRAPCPAPVRRTSPTACGRCLIQSATATPLWPRPSSTSHSGGLNTGILRRRGAWKR